MPRKKLIRSSEHPYHVTSRSNNKEWFYIDIDKVWYFSQKILEEGTQKFNVNIEAFVLMSNHYHMLLQTPEANIDQFMKYLNQNLGKSIAREAGRINRIFGAPYKWSLIQSNTYYQNVLRYIYQNPLRANIVTDCQDYPYSDLMVKHPELLEWVNTPLNEYDQEKTRKNLRKKVISND